jgi:hypothetical protein
VTRASASGKIAIGAHASVDVAPGARHEHHGELDFLSGAGAGGVPDWGGGESEEMPPGAWIASQSQL